MKTKKKNENCHGGGVGAWDFWGIYTKIGCNNDIKLESIHLQNE